MAIVASDLTSITSSGSVGAAVMGPNGTQIPESEHVAHPSHSIF